MSDDRLFLDTVFIQAILNRHDQYYAEALPLLARIRTAAEVWTTEAVLVEVGNALSVRNRLGAAAFIRSCYRTPNMRVVSVDTPLLDQAITLYEARSDKGWGLTDCISFSVMYQRNLTEAATADLHFAQAGFHLLLAPRN